MNVTPTPDAPVNAGVACPKGWEALAPLRASDRATTPLLRERGDLRPVSWEVALDTFVRRFKAIGAAHGPESVAFLGTGQLPNVELALLGCLAKHGMGMRHGDGNTRQCMATAVVAYKQCFGFDAPPYTYEDLELSDTLVFIGANPAIAHPVLWSRVVKRRERPAIVVVDPRRTETAALATLHLAPAPKSDLVLLYGLARLLIERGAVDRAFVDAHTTDFDAFARHVAPFTLARVVAATGLAAEEVERLADLVARGARSRS